MNDDLVALLRQLSSYGHSDTSIGGDAADRIEAQAARIAELQRERESLILVVSDLQSALEYHQEQTRPIHSTRNAILAARAALAPKESA
jgi:cell division protein FtsB